MDPWQPEERPVSKDLPFFLAVNDSLAGSDPRDDLLHPERNKLVQSDSCTETQYFGFCVPEARIQAFCYLWHHPNLRLVSGGLFVFKGDKHTVVHGELCDFRSFMSDAPLRNDLHEYRLENGYGVKILEPLKRHRVTYADTARQNVVDVEMAAVRPPVMYGDGNHFEQAMKVNGKLTLRGVQYDVDCFTIRDRSWGRPRSEAPLPVPATSWMVGVFNEGFAFSASVFEQQEMAPELRPPLAIPIEKTLNGGWLDRDGRIGVLVRARKRVVRAPGSFIPRYVELEITDDLDRSLSLRGTSCATTLWQAWPNMTLPICQMRWEADGLIAYGECQEGNWNDHLNELQTG